jgi:hypothetical protein
MTFALCFAGCMAALEVEHFLSGDGDAPVVESELPVTVDSSVQSSVAV